MDFIFTLINPGCFVAIVAKDSLVAEGFYAHVDDFKSSENYTLFQKKSRARTHVFIDLERQYYSREKLPAMNAWKRRKILQYKCVTENPRLQSIHFRKESKDTYLFMDLTLSENHLSWLEFLEKSKHPLKQPRLLPLEMETLLQDKRLLTLPEKECLIALYYEELVGLRQIIFIDGKIAASRLTAIQDQDIKRQIALEVDETLLYLAAERGVDPKNFGLIYLSNPALFSKLPPLAHSVADWSSFQKSPLQRGLPFSIWSMAPLSLLRKKPQLSLALKSLESYVTKERRRFVFILGGLFCLWTLALGGFIARQYEQILGNKLLTLEEKIKEIPTETPMDAITLSPEEQALGHGYGHLKAATPNPFILLGDAQEWLQDHWNLKHVEWGYHSPKFKRESWVLDPPASTHETLDLWVDYLGADSLQQKARDAQIRLPIKNHKVMKNTYIKEIEVIRIIKEGINL
jgi:hypothetical protein